MFIPLTFPKYPLIDGVIVHVWYVLSGKLSNTQYLTKNDELLRTGLAVRKFGEKHRTPQ